MKIKVSEATNLQLDWLVAKCVVGEETARVRVFAVGKPYVLILNDGGKPRGGGLIAAFSTSWAQGGPIIDRMMSESGLVLQRNANHRKKETACVASLDTPAGFHFGPTPLVAAMRCYVASKLGDEVGVPDELA